MSQPAAVLLVVDAQASSGMGHVVRSEVLAAALLAHGIASYFVTRNPSEAANQHLARGHWPHFRLVSNAKASPLGSAAASSVVALAGTHGTSTVVVDSYEAEPAFLRTLADAGQRVAVIEDGHPRDLTVASWVLNQNLKADSSKAVLDAGATALRGPHYALLRPEFAAVRSDPHTRDTATRLLVTLGGGDVGTLHAAALMALKRAPGPIQVRCLLSASAAAHPAVIAAASSSVHEVKVVQGFSDPTEHMLWCDLALTAGGSTMLELMCLGVPMIIRPTSAAEAESADELAARGCGIVASFDGQISALVTGLASDPGRRRVMSHKGMALVDGLGARRAAESLASLIVAS